MLVGRARAAPLGVTGVHDFAGRRPHDAPVNSVPDTTASAFAPHQIFLVRRAREALARLSPDRRNALTEGFQRVGQELLASAQQVPVPPAWSRRTLPRRRYPQQCYPRTTKYVLDHADIDGIQLVHGVAAHAPHFVPLDHAWVLLPGGVVFDGVVQAFFTRPSYYGVMAAVALDTYSAADARRLVAAHGHPGPWNASWVPTAAQLRAYAAMVPAAQRGPLAAEFSGDVGKNRYP
jgi:hypothetical protein